MKENKSIERLFQEQFKDFEANPPSESWKNIEARLKQKKNKKRVIPFWFKSTGIAASLAIVFFLFVNKGNDSSLIKNDSNVLKNNPVSNVEKKENAVNNSSENQINTTTIKKNNLLKEEPLSNDKNVVLENKSSNKSDESTQNKKGSVNNNLNTGVVLNKKSKINSKPSVNNNEVFNNQSLTFNNKDQNKPNNKKKLFADEEGNPINKNQSLATNDKTQIKTNNKKTKQLFINENAISDNQGLETNNKTQIKSNNNEKLFVNQNPNSVDKNQGLVTNNKTQNISINNSNEEIFFNKNNNSINNNELVLSNNKEEKSLINKTKIELLNSDYELNNELVVSENSTSLEKIDSLLIKNENIIANAVEDSILLALVETQENPLEKLLREKLEGKNVDEKEKEKRNKWAVSTVASPIYFNSVSQGSSLDSRLESNSKDYGNSLSFGLGLEYELSNKWSLKAGVNTLSLDYNTNDVMFFQDVNARTMENVTPSQTGSMLSVQSKKTANLNTINTSGTLVQKFDGEINQKMGYIEVPLELSYKLLDKKFGINVIGGMSTLFLNENKVSLISNDSQINIGEANNLNNIHFSSNVGLGFKYTFWKSFQANFQPMFKYQINTFSNDSGNFKPYFVGLYSGISFSF